jgi:hypothetical protein
MKKIEMKRWVNGIVSALLLLTLVAVSGCGSSDSGNPVSAADQYQQKVYIIGEIQDPSTSATGEISLVRGPVEAVKDVFVKRVAYDGVSTDAPVFIASDQVLSLSDAVKAGLLATYGKGNPIILVRGDEIQINTLLGILGLEQNYKLAENFSYAELFAVSAETGARFVWAMYPPGTTQSDKVSDTYADNSTGRLNRATMFGAWVKQNGTRAQALTSFRKEATTSLTAEGANAADESDLTKLAKLNQYVKVFTDLISGNTYQVIFNMYSCHSFSSIDGKSYDWFYVEQNGSLNAAQGYKGIKDTTEADIADVPGAFAWGGQQTARYYVGSYTMSNSMMSQGNVTTDQSLVLESSSPETNNTKTTTRSGISFNISGNVGFKAGASTAQGGSLSSDINGSLTTGVTISNQKDVDTYDCTVENKSMSSGYTDDALWLYTFNRPDQFGWIIFFAHLNSPVKLSVNTFQPVNKWIWKLSPEVREGKKSYKNVFKTNLTVENMITISGCSFAWIPTFGPYHGSKVSKFDDYVPLEYPPLIVAPSVNVTFSAAGQVKYMNASVSRDWSATSDQSWCQAVPATGKGNNTQLSITVDANTTGKERKATVTFAINGDKDKDTMTVTQSQY